MKILTHLFQYIEIGEAQAVTTQNERRIHRGDFSFTRWTNNLILNTEKYPKHFFFCFTSGTQMLRKRNNLVLLKLIEIFPLTAIDFHRVWTLCQESQKQMACFWEGATKVNELLKQRRSAAAPLHILWNLLFSTLFPAIALLRVKWKPLHPLFFLFSFFLINDGYRW